MPGNDRIREATIVRAGSCTKIFQLHHSYLIKVFCYPPEIVFHVSHFRCFEPALSLIEVLNCHVNLTYSGIYKWCISISSRRKSWAMILCYKMTGKFLTRLILLATITLATT